MAKAKKNVRAADSFRRDLHKDLKAGRHAFPETICRHTTTLGTLNAL